MKKLILFFISTTMLTLSSCNKDDNKETIVKTLKATVNGVEVTFDTFKVIKTVIPNDGEPYTELEITATKSNDPTKIITFNVDYSEAIAAYCPYFAYIGVKTDVDTEYFYDIDIAKVNPFVVKITANTTNNLKGTFTGTLNDSTDKSVTITNGIFDITY